MELSIVAALASSIYVCLKTVFWLIAWHGCQKKITKPSKVPPVVHMLPENNLCTSF